MANSFHSNISEVKLIDKLKQCIDTCAAFYFSVSFIKKPELRLLAPNIETALVFESYVNSADSTTDSFGTPT